MKKSSGRTRVRKGAVPTVPGLPIDPATRSAFVAGKGVPGYGPRGPEFRATMRRVMQEIPVERFHGTKLTSAIPEAPRPEAGSSVAPALRFLSEAEARGMEPTAPESVAAQCDGLAVEFELAVSNLAKARYLFAVSRTGPSQEQLKLLMANLESIAATTVQLRNSLATYISDA